MFLEEATRFIKRGILGCAIQYNLVTFGFLCGIDGFLQEFFSEPASLAFGMYNDVFDVKNLGTAMNGLVFDKESNSGNDPTGVLQNPYLMMIRDKNV